MRLDEFSAPADIDGVFTATERTRFVTFGFDIAFDSPVEAEEEDQKINRIVVIAAGARNG